MIGWARTVTWLASAVVVIAAAAIAAPQAGGQSAAVIQSVSVEGDAVVDSILTATVVLSDPTVAPRYRWQRCSGDTVSTCDRIKAAPDAPSYTVRPNDVGFRVAVRAVTNVMGDKDGEFSNLTGVVTETAAAPTPTPTPTPTPEPSPDPGDTSSPPPAPPTFNQTGGPPPASTPPPVLIGNDAPHYLRPFPVVRVKGMLVHGGARITLMRVTAPLLARVVVRCEGPGCHLRRLAFGSRRVRALERFLRSGTRITIRVTKPDAIGKYVRLLVRNGSPPKRRDACLMPGGSAPVQCPAA
jgi:hypothetical protein